MNYKATILASGAIMALMAMPARAQDTAQAPQGAENSGGIEEIVVTAQRREERLQDVPVTVSVVTADKIASTNIQDAAQIGRLVTGVLIASGNTTLQPFIRGVGTSQRAAGSEASVATYIDGIYVPRINTAALRLFSVQNIEVLKGPQGTLFGRNSSGGLINIITKTPEPGSAFTARTEVGYANYSTLTVNGYAASGLGEKAGIDIAYTLLDQRRGWGFNRTLKTDVRKEDSKAVRSKFVFQPADETRVTLAASYINFDSDRGNQDHYEDQLQGYPAGTPLRGQSQPLKGHFDEEAEIRRPITIHSWDASARIEHETSLFTITNTASYQHSKLRVVSDTDFSSQASVIFRNSELTKSFTNELLIQSNPGSSIKWTAGAYYGRLIAKYVPAETFGPSFNAVVGAGNTRVGFSSQTTKTYAAFGQATVPVGPATNITVGGRVTHDKVRASGFFAVALGGFPSTQPLVPFGVPPLPATNSYTKYSWRLGVDHHFTEDVMAYASASRGLKSSTFNILNFADRTPIRPEITTAYEVGIKSDLLDRRLRVNVAGFYTKVKDLQQPIITLVNGIPTTGTRNIPGLRSYGFDFEVTSAITRELEVRAAYTYTNAKYTAAFLTQHFTYNPVGPAFGNTVANLDANGNQGERAPRHTFNIGASYTVPIGNDELSLDANYAHTGKFFWNPDNRVTQKSYGLLDMQIKFAKKDPNVYIAVWGSNLTNEKYFSDVQQTATTAGTVGIPSAPRTYGVKIGFSF